LYKLTVNYVRGSLCEHDSTFGVEQYVFFITNINLAIMKKATLVVQQKMLSKDEMKNILGGLKQIDDGCLILGASCNDSVQCCSNNCASDSSDPVTGKKCAA
jgi:hypothetical protein